jgi:two-component sensor histidine kinase
MRRSYVIHIICWSIIILFPLFFVEHSETYSEIFSRYLRNVGVQISFLVVFYINYVYLIPRVLFKDKTKLFFLYNILVVIGAFLLSFFWRELFTLLLPEMQPERWNHPHPPKWPFHFQYILSLILFIGLSAAIRMSERWAKSEVERREAEKSRTEAELKNLRNQLNPHFLLNTLNNIYALIAFDTAKAQKVVEELSKLLRHVLYDNQQNFVPICKEAEFMRNYIELMKIRVTDNVKIDTDIDISPDDNTEVAPLLFISLVENAFKHGISPSEPSYINIHFKEEDGDIFCEIKNSNFPKRANDKSGSGIGLEQVSKRLELMYKGRYVWEKGVSENGKEYSSKIIIRHESTLRNS